MDQVNEENPLFDDDLNHDLKSLQLTKKNIAPRLPWLSIFSSLLLISLILINNNPLLRDFYHIPVLPEHSLILFITLICVGSIYLLDIRLFMRKNIQIQHQINELKRQLNLVSLSKKKQQQRANTFSDHSEKLKMFISDKLLEYMEYDEKFIHFKGIASEVRHNGVISYDKVMTALNKAIQQQHFLSLYEQHNNTAETETNNQTINALTDYQSALDAMRYLWDLLDLSTADNMALHIGNKLIECEEHYYQLQLDTNQTLDITQSIPVSPTFFPQIAVLMTFSLISDDIEIRNFITLSKINETILKQPFLFDNGIFHIALEPTPELLGNHNHIVLLLENLIKNAQFFTHKSRYKQKTDRINVQLYNLGDHVYFSIYNRGPQITQEDHDEIFKLGVSTRRNKQHHGKGLGLFFAKEIVRGYQGSIEANNIENTECQYQLKLNLSNKESVIYNIITQFNHGKMQVKQVNDNEWLNELTILQDRAIDSIEVRVQECDVEPPPLQSELIDHSSTFNWLEPEKSLLSQWLIQVTPYKKQHRLIFKPLDIKGVCFNIKLPTAASHLNE